MGSGEPECEEGRALARLGPVGAVLQHSIDSPAVPYVVDGHEASRGIKLIDNPVVTDADSIESLGAGELDRLFWLGLDRQALDSIEYARCGVSRKYPQVLANRWLEDNPTGRHRA
jgi:hypothetical protein